MAQYKSGDIAVCPECDGPVNLGSKRKIGQKLTCRRCRSELVIAERRPLELVLLKEWRSERSAGKQAVKQREDSRQAQNSQKNADEDEVNSEMSTITDIFITECPECDSKLRFRKPLKIGKLVICPKCDEPLEVISLQPLELGWADEAPWDFDTYDDQHIRPGTSF